MDEGKVIRVPLFPEGEGFGNHERKETGRRMESAGKENDRKV